jgi:hypothetical protein
MCRYCTVLYGVVTCCVQFAALGRSGDAKSEKLKREQVECEKKREGKRRERERERLPVLESETQEKQQWSKGAAQQQAQQHTAAMPRVRTAAAHARGARSNPATWQTGTTRDQEWHCK